MRLVLFTAFCASVVGAASLPVRVVHSECPAIGNQPVCEYRNGYLFRFSRQFDPVMRVFGPDGRPAMLVPIAVPGAQSGWAEDVGVDADGSVVAGVAGSVDGTLAGTTKFGLALFDTHGVQTSFIDTQGFRPGHIAVAEDHSIWVLGALLHADEYMVLRKYSRSGELLGSYLPRSTFPKGLEPGGAGAETSVVAAGHLVVVLAHSGMTGSLREVIELDGTGKVLGRMRLDGRYRRLALTADGHLYTQADDLILLNPVEGTSRKLDNPVANSGLVGADGNHLVYRVHGPDGLVSVGSFPQP